MGLFDVVKTGVRGGARGAAAVYTGGLSESKKGKKNPIVGGIGKGVGTVFSGGLTGVWNAEDAKAQAMREYQDALAEERRRRRETQLGILNEMQAPQLSPQAAKRIAALEAESAPRALAEDPLYTGQRAQLLGAGQQLQSGIESEQLGRGVRGGFANIGSTQDVQDRLGVQLAGLASQAQATRERKRDLAAQASQALQDAQTDFANAQRQARMAIEAGDSDMALSMINQAMQAKTAAAEAERAMYASIIGGTTRVIGGAMAGPGGFMAGGQAADAITGGGGGGGGYSLGANTDYGKAAEFEGFEVKDTGSNISNMSYANAKRRGYY